MVAVCSVIAQAQIPAGSEFQVSARKAGVLTTSPVAMDTNGDFVVVWQREDGDGVAVRWRRFSAAGVALGAGRANTYTTGNQQRPSVASDANGNFIVVWESEGQDGSGAGIFGQRYDSSGAKRGAEFNVNAHTMDYQTAPAVASDASGNFAVVWNSDLQDGSVFGVFGRVFDSAGNPVGSFRANSYTTGSQSEPAVASDGNGNFVIVWTSFEQDGGGIFGRRVDASGAFLGSEFRVNSYTTGSHYSASVASAGDGSFVVVWQDYHRDGSTFGIFGRRFNAAGVAQGSDFQINAYTTGPQVRPRVAADARGGFVVSWESNHQDPLGDIFGRRFDASGAPLGGDFRVNSYTTSSQARPSVASSPDGDFVIIWDGPGQAGYGYGVFGQRYGDLIFEDNFESGDTSRWSSSVTDGTDLDVTAAAGLAGTAHGMRTLVNDTNSLYVQDDTPDAESRYRARFYFDPNGFDPGEANSHFRVRIFLAQDASNVRAVTIVLKRQGGQYSIEGLARLNDGTRADTGFFDITNAPHFIEFDWKRATGPGASDGYLALLIDNVTVSFLPGLDNDQVPVDQARLGVLSIKTGAAGTLRFDQFESRRQNLIGPE
jgi:hypothetical protein